MKYKGIELKEFTSDKPVLFDPPKRMLVWDSEKGRDGSKGRVHVTVDDDHSEDPCFIRLGRWAMEEAK